MKNLILLGLLAISLSACALATAVPTQAPHPTLPPSGPSAATIIAASTAVATKALPPNSGITVKDVQQVTKSDGTVSKTANVATQDNLGLGQLEMTYPDTMLLSDTRRIILRITPAQQLASLTPVAAPSKTPGTPTVVYFFSGNLQLYPVMIAQLRTLAFDVDLPGHVSRTLDGTKQVTWEWIVKPRLTGRHDLSVEISIPVVRGGVATEITTDVLQNVPLTIQVNAPPAPTPTTVPLATRIGDSLINNAGAIIVALIGLIGTVIGIWLKARSDQAKAASDSASKKS
ncbi:hypothetical protein ANRL1_00947 [Anaerolineae bacterium]|nr:hypothetical protein ANRL1_00947 [Anaerolineae bacterium]